MNYTMGFPEVKVTKLKVKVSKVSASATACRTAYG